MFIVVGYEKRPCSANYPQMMYYGNYETFDECKKRIIELCGRYSQFEDGSSITHGNSYTCWIQHHSLGSQHKMMNFGAYEKIS